MAGRASDAVVLEVTSQQQGLRPEIPVIACQPCPPFSGSRGHEFLVIWRCNKDLSYAFKWIIHIGKKKENIRGIHRENTLTLWPLKRRWLSGHLQPVLQLQPVGVVWRCKATRVGNVSSSTGFHLFPTGFLSNLKLVREIWRSGRRFVELSIFFFRNSIWFVRVGSYWPCPENGRILHFLLALSWMLLDDVRKNSQIFGPFFHYWGLARLRCRSHRKCSNRCNSSRCNSSRCNSSRCNSSRCNSSRCNSSRCSSSRCNSSRCNKWRDGLSCCGKWHSVLFLGQNLYQIMAVDKSHPVSRFLHYDRG